MDQPWIGLFSFCLALNSVWSCCKPEIHRVSLSCYNCNLSTVPPDLPEEIKELDLSFNPLNRLYNRSLSRLSQLQILDLTRCGITSVDDDAFAGLSTLHTLFLTGNPIKHWSQVTFSGLYSLKKLVIVETSLTSLSELHVGYLPSLQELNAAKNSINRLYIPSFFINLHTLDLRANHITKIDEKDLENLRHANTSNLSLILSQNPIHFIDPGAFRSIALRLLHLKGCFSHDDILNTSLNAMSGLRLETIVIGQYRNSPTRVYFKENLFEGLCGMDVKEVTIFEIYVRDTTTFFDCMENITSLRFIHTNLHWFRPISVTSNMQKFELKYSFIEKVPSHLFSKLHHLKEIRLTDNRRLVSFPEFLYDSNKLEVLDLSKNNLMIESCCDKLISGKFLKHLNFSYNTFIGLRSIFLDMPHLLTLNLSHSKVDSIGSFPIFIILQNLIYLDLSYSSCHFMIHCTFCGLYSLVELHVSHNTFAPDILGSVFQNLSSLRLLDMTSCNLEYIPNETFGHLKRLEVLKLSRNKLMELSASVLLSLAALKHLYISTNNIQGLSNDTTQILSKGLVNVDLAQNPYDCSCTQEKFLLWVREQSSQGLNFGSPLECKTPEHLQGSLLKDVYLNCSWTLVYVSMAVVVVIIFLTLLVYHFYLKNCFLFLCFWRKDYKKSASETSYDAFVIHSSLDEEWVRRELLPELEDGMPSFQLCVHFRNFEPGKLILENIFYNGICCSRNALVILSPNFLESKWCSFELRLATFWKFLENQCGMILILLEPIRKGQLKHMSVLKRHLSRNTYLKWEDEQKKRKVFWKRLRQALSRGREVTAPLLGLDSVAISNCENKQNKESSET
ncbi:toll-like receptor 4 [Mantella aurantiaca]